MWELIELLGVLLSSFLAWLASLTQNLIQAPMLAPLGIFILLAVLGTVIGMLRKWLPGRA
jgi:hypothetical protein